RGRIIRCLKGVCWELLVQYGESHMLFLQILSEFPYFKDTRERVRRTYQRHLEMSIEPRAEVLEKRTQVESSDSAPSAALETPTRAEAPAPAPRPAPEKRAQDESRASAPRAAKDATPERAQSAAERSVGWLAA